MFSVIYSNIFGRYPFKEGQKVKLADWELYINDIAKDILEDQTPKR